MAKDGLMEESGRKVYALDQIHPALAVAYFALMLVFTMVVVEPVYLMISFAAAVAFGLYARGWRSVLKSLLWQLPLIALIALVNLLFSPVGSTQLFRIGTHASYLESLYFGLCLGMMLAAVMSWFSNASAVLSSDKVMAVFGTTLPTISLMMSMALRLIPQFVDRGRQIGDATWACSSVRARGAKEKAASRIRLTSILMGWSMEDSLETADSMRARGWNAKTRRSTYRRYRFRRKDLAMALVLAVLAALVAVTAWQTAAHFQFYPKASALEFSWGYLLFALLALLPVLICIGDSLRWRQ